MAKTRGRKTVVRSQYRQYEQVADHFYEAARDAMDLEYWTAAGVLIVHAGIAYADAVCIQQAGVRSAADDHEEAVALLDESLQPDDATSKAVQHLRHIIAEKTKVSYLGELYTPRQAKALWQHLERFRTWVKQILLR
jgi:hypothetical protein